VYKRQLLLIPYLIACHFADQISRTSLSIARFYLESKVEYGLRLQYLVVEAHSVESQP